MTDYYAIIPDLPGTKTVGPFNLKREAEAYIAKRYPANKHAEVASEENLPQWYKDANGIIDEVVE